MVMYVPIKEWNDRPTKPNEKGYVLVWVPEHPKSFCGGWYYEHRLSMEAHLGRVLDKKETVHHISENKNDSSVNNLFVCTRPEHDNAVWITS